MRSRQATRVAAVLALAAMATLVGCGQMATRPTVQKGTEGTTSQGVIQSLLTDGGPGPAPATAQLITTTEDSSARSAVSSRRASSRPSSRRSRSWAPRA